MLLIKTINKCYLEFLWRIYFYTWCLVILVSICNEVHVFCLINGHNGNYTDNSGLCVNHSTSCSHQMRMPNVTSDSCKMIFHPKNSEVCQSENIRDGLVDAEERYGKAQIMTYAYFSNSINMGPVFNVSFTDIKWKKVYMRFIENKVKTPSLCREFEVIPELSSSFTLYFDCIWSNEIEQKALHFEYQAFTPSGDSFTYKYLFKVPNGNQIVEDTPLWNYTIFMVVDITSMPELLTLRLQVAPKHFGIKSYKVEVHKFFKDDSPWLVNKGILYPEPGQTELRFSYETKSKFGKYVFNVTPIHDNCTKRNPCTTSTTPHILIAAVSPYHPHSHPITSASVEMAEPKILTGVVTVVILIPIILMGYLIWKKSWDPSKDQVREPPGPPKLLLMYNPVSVKHVQSMIELAKYFNKVCGLVALIDELGIPESTTKDPVRWYIDAFTDADYVAIFASPNATPADRKAVQKFSRYQHIETIAQNQLSHRLCSTETRCKFFSIALPDTNWDTLPPEAAALKRYILPRDLDPLLVYIGVSPQCDGGTGFYAALQTAEQLAAKALEPAPLPPPIHPPPSEVHPIAEEDEDDGRASPCCNTLSVSDLELVSSRQFLSDTDTASSIDHLSLLGDA